MLMLFSFYTWGNRSKLFMAIILTVEDDEDVREYFKQHLLAWGHTVIEADTGKAAVMAMRSVLPDIILMDIGLPDISGLDAVKLIRDSERTNDLKVIALTAADDTETREQAEELGFVDYLTKPVIDPDDIRDTIDRYL